MRIKIQGKSYKVESKISPTRVIVDTIHPGSRRYCHAEKKKGVWGWMWIGIEGVLGPGDR